MIVSFLRSDQSPINSINLHQFLVSAFLNNFPKVQNKNFIRIKNSRKTMGNSNDCFSLTHCLPRSSRATHEHGKIFCNVAERASGARHTWKSLSPKFIYHSCATTVLL